MIISGNPGSKSAYLAGMKLLLAALCALITCLPARATLWRGTILQTLTETNDPRNTVGETFVGSYEYESDTVDAVLNPYLDRSHLHATLATFYASAHDGGVVTTDFALFLSTQHFTVRDGAVSTFAMWGQTGYDFNFYTTGFNSSYFNYITDTMGGPRFFLNNGTMSFSAPEAVPETAATVTLLTFGLIALAALSSNKNARQSPGSRCRS